MKMRLAACLAAMLFATCLDAFAQTTSNAEPTITFKFFWAQAHPSTYQIVLPRNGQARYDSEDNVTPSQQKNSPVESNQQQSSVPTQPFHTTFQASAPLVQKVFSLAAKDHFFDRDFDYTKHPVAQNGRKTLSFADQSQHHSTTYNFSEDPSIQELTSIFQGIASTLQMGQKLNFDRRFDKLGLDADLESLQEQVEEGQAVELQLIAPILQSLATDQTVLHIAQQRARRILHKAGQSATAPAAE